MPPKNNRIVAAATMATYSSDIDHDHDDLPDLSAILAPRPLMATSGNANIRRSPRKNGSTVQNTTQSPEKKEKREAITSVSRSGRAKGLRTEGDDIPGVSRHGGKAKAKPNANVNISASSNNSQSPEVLRAQRPWPLPHLDSLMLPSSLQLKKENDKAILSNENQSIMALMTTAGRSQEDTKQQKSRTLKPQGKRASQPASRASRFILHEARCNDDLANSADEEDNEDEDTDLSGFIVDDDAELSYHDWSNSDSDSDFGIESNDDEEVKVQQTKPRRRRLMRGSPTRRKLSFVDNDDSNSGKESESEDKRGRHDDHDGLMEAFTNLDLQDKSSKKKSNTLTDAEIEVIDLTSSPSLSPKLRFDPDPDLIEQPISRHRPTTSHKRSKAPSDISNLFDDFDRVLTLAPPSAPPALKIPSKTSTSTSHAIPVMEDNGDGDLKHERNETKDHFQTPPATPPQSPTKLKSPSKLLSPSKRQIIPHSPHRQSMDAFWDHNVINDWNDEYSPKKEPARSPRKWLEQFQIWTDDESDSHNDSDIEKYFLDDSTGSLPSPVAKSPRKPQVPRSPAKSPEKEEKRRLAEQNKVRIAAKRAFDSKKEELAMSLFNELDMHVANGQLSTMASSTGGVKIIWSRTLRSTAGRANWKRTVDKTSNSPIKSEQKSKYKGVPGINVQHFASIELAEKVIDREERLVNTLAHEFCHLTNFMISGVRDNPHGASFKEWAAKATRHLQNNTTNPIWRQVQVTTKHSYAIDHKYLWICSGRDKTQAMEMLNIADGDDQGCGAEYGRHSKSIDTAKQRCGRCRGVLVQVRPKPRAAPGLGASPRKKRDVKKVDTGSNRAVSGETDDSSGSGSSQGDGSQSSSTTTTMSTTTSLSMSASMIDIVELSD
ncbi:hypothetical protein PV10_00708 [Exophiala mesophila]|uniref:SprT-like domain-containing protein n=1 Tax=Exophiala mesophila TaxID=212818 RepID=A0A0D1ZSJ9_EXOME|nr:uncharacterized protein PV10_00708 [Exophiala mesophila]KIV96894.1 hypothetical protein PV10_00708 [Exophiala mesophila]